MKITHIEHACFLFETNGIRIVTDPYSTDMRAAVKATPALLSPDYVLITHGHGDHMSGLPNIAGKRTKVVAVVELAGYLSGKGFDAMGMNFGGEVDLCGVKAAMTQAIHTSSVQEKGLPVYAGLACGFVICAEGHAVYFAGDTDIFGDMALIRTLYKPDVVILPVGGYYTMDVKKAVVACRDLLKPNTLIPMHYDTFPLIRADLSPLNELTETKTVILNNGEYTVI